MGALIGSVALIGRVARSTGEGVGELVRSHLRVHRKLSPDVGADVEGVKNSWVGWLCWFRCPGAVGCLFVGAGGSGG
jgi:hypothetical protein